MSNGARDHEGEIQGVHGGDAAAARPAPGRVTLTQQLAAVVQRRARATPFERPASAIDAPPIDDWQVAAWPLVVDDAPGAAAVQRVETRAAWTVDAPREVDEQRATLEVPTAKTPLSRQQLAAARRANAAWHQQLRFAAGAFGVDDAHSADFAIAVAEFQQQHGLQVDGVAGPHTIKAKRATARGGKGEGGDEHDGSPVQGRATAGGDLDAHAPAIAAQGVAGAGGPLPFLDELKHSFGAHGDVLDGVRAHTGGDARAAAAAIGADAYATGADVAFAVTPTRELVGHEAAHVVQQRAGVSLKGGVGEAGDAYEQHADQVGAAFAAGGSVEALLDRFAGGRGGGERVQRKATAGPSADDRGPEGAADLHARIVDYRTSGNDSHLTFDAGRKQGVVLYMRGYVQDGDGMVADFQIESVTDKHSKAVVYGFRPEQLAGHTVVINPGQMPTVKKARKDYRTRIVESQTDHEGSVVITINGGQTQGVSANMPGVLLGKFEHRHFVIHRVNASYAYARVQASVDQVRAEPDVIVNPTSVG
jgi:Domain of unknown function (DUF4157)/Putative peptidoglycan binding domain